MRSNENKSSEGGSRSPYMHRIKNSNNFNRCYDLKTENKILKTRNVQSTASSPPRHNSMVEFAYNKKGVNEEQDKCSLIHQLHADNSVFSASNKVYDSKRKSSMVELNEHCDNHKRRCFNLIGSMQKDLNISIDSNDRKLKYSHSNNLIPLSGMVEYTPNIGYCKIENRGRIDLINDNQKLLKCRSEREIATPNRNSLMFDNLKILKQKNFEPQHLYVDVECSSLNKSLNKQSNKNTHQLRYQTKYRINNGNRKIDEKRMTQDYSNLQSSKNLICKSLEGFSFKGNSTTNFKEMKVLFKQSNSKNQNIVYHNKEISIIPSNKNLNDCKLDINLYAEDN